MTERKDARFAIGIPLEIKVTKGGAEVLYDVFASDEQTAHEFAGAMSEITGSKCEIVDEKESPSRSFFISNWDRSVWKPTGPKPKGVTTKNPSLN